MGEQLLDFFKYLFLFSIIQSEGERLEAVVIDCIELSYGFSIVNYGLSMDLKRIRLGFVNHSLLSLK